MKDFTAAKELTTDWRHLSRVRAWQYVWAMRNDPEASPAVRTAGEELVREFSELIKHLTAECETVVSQLAEYDQTHSVLVDAVLGKGTSS